MWTYLLTALVATAPAEWEARAIDGRAAVGSIARLSAEELVLETADGPASFPLASLAAVARTTPATPSDRKPSVVVELVDGTSLAATSYAVRGGTASIETGAGQRFDVPTRRVRLVRFGAPMGADEKLTKQWSEIVDAKAAGDVLVIRKSEALDYFEGVLGDVDADKCAFELDKEPISVKLPKIEGLIYYHAQPPALDEPMGLLVAADGTRLAIRSLELTDSMLKVATPTGVSLGV
jgi:hypothetical protein